VGCEFGSLLTWLGYFLAAARSAAFSASFFWILRVFFAFWRLRSPAWLAPMCCNLTWGWS